MTHPDQIRAFSSDVRKVIRRYRSEFDLTYEMMIGTLEIIKHGLLDELIVESHNDDDDDNESWRNAAV